MTTRELLERFNEAMRQSAKGAVKWLRKISAEHHQRYPCCKAAPGDPCCHELGGVNGCCDNECGECWPPNEGTVKDIRDEIREALEKYRGRKNTKELREEIAKEIDNILRDAIHNGASKEDARQALKEPFQSLAPFQEPVMKIDMPGYEEDDE